MGRRIVFYTLIFSFVLLSEVFAQTPLPAASPFPEPSAGRANDSNSDVAPATPTAKPSASASPSTSPTPSSSSSSTVILTLEQMQQARSLGVSNTESDSQLIELLEHLGQTQFAARISPRAGQGYFDIFLDSNAYAVEEIEVVTPKCIMKINTKRRGTRSETHKHLLAEIRNGGYCWALAAYHSRQRVGDLARNLTNDQRRNELNEMIARAGGDNFMKGQRAAHGANFTCVDEPGMHPDYGKPITNKEDCKKLSRLLKDPKNDCTVNVVGYLVSTSLMELDAHAINATSAAPTFLGGSCKITATDTGAQGDNQGNVENDEMGSDTLIVPFNFVNKAYYHCCRYNK